MVSPGGSGVARELVAEVVEREFESDEMSTGVGDGFGQVGEEAGHFARGFEVALGVAGEQAAGFGERGLVFAGR